MCDWRKWILPGILSTVILTALAMLLHAGSIQKELSQEATIAASAQHDWARVELDGRDLTLTGIAPTEPDKKAAKEILKEVYGVRVVTDASKLPPIVSPYTFSAVKSDDGIAFNGSFPNADVRAAIVSAAEQANPGATVTDNLTIGRGAPDSFGEIVTFGVSQLGSLAEGEVTLSNIDYSIAGTASSIDDFAALSAALTGALPAGAALAANEVIPPAVAPFTWSATKAD
ncbi:MAG: BON domain-containing protein, partial [Pseudomonadota bacterium]